MAATAAEAPAAAAVPDQVSAPPAPLPSAPPHCNYKNLLQEFLQRANKKLPIYITICKGEHHQLKFESTVTVDSEEFSSTCCHRRVKDAEQDAAKVAYDILVGRKESDVNVTDVFELIDQDVVFSKSILHEFATKTNAAQPSYSVFKPAESRPITPFVASVLFAGNTYTGGAARNKKDAEQKAARAAIKSILGTNNTCMVQIIRSKENFITATAPSGYNKERGAAGQEINNNPANTSLLFAPIKFTAPVIYESYGGPSGMVPVSQPISSSPLAVQEPNTMPEADPSFKPSAQAADVSKKRKNRTSEPEAKEERVLQ